MAASPQTPPHPRYMQIFREVIIEGKPRANVAAAYKLKVCTVDRYIRQVERWLAVQVIQLESMLVGNVHLERLEHQWNELMVAWGRSKQDQVISKASTDHEGRKRAEQTRKSSPGDVRYLEQARRVLSDIRALLGLTHLPTEQELMDDAQTLTLEQRMALLDRLLQKFGHTPAAPANVSTDSRGTDAPAPAPIASPRDAA